MASPLDERELRNLLYTALQSGVPFVVRYPRGKGPGTDPGEDFETVEIGRALKRRTGTRTAFLGFGSMTNVLEKAAQNLDGTLWDMRFVKPIDREAVIEAARTHDLIVTAEEGVLAGGAGDAVMEVIAEAGLTTPVLCFGIPDEFIEQGTQAEIYEMLGLTPEAVEAKVVERLAQLS